MSLKSRHISDHLQQLLPLTPAVFFILFALADGEKHGYAITQAVATLSADACRMGPGTLYCTIQRLPDLSLIEETSGPAAASGRESGRRYYRLTRNGNILLDTEVSGMESVVHLAKRKPLVAQESEQKFRRP